MTDFDSVYPLEVYRHVSNEGRRLADGEFVDGQLVGGTILPPFTRHIAEAIASTRPDWARLKDTDIAPEVRTDDYEHIYIAWSCVFGDRVAVTQEIAYEWSGEMIGCLAGALGSVDVTIGKCERAYLEAVARSHFWLSWRCRRRGGGACWGRRVARVPRSRRSGSELTPRLPRRGAICTSLAGRIARSRRSSLVPRGRRGC